MNQNQYTLVECPRDAMQGLRHWVPTEVKISYLQLLMGVGFDVLDAGSMVSASAVPQMKDSAEVLSALDRSASKTRISVVVANDTGLQQALDHEAVSVVGYPFSVSETFQKRNTRRTCEEAYRMIEPWSEAVNRSGRELWVYLSMGFGNPYGDAYSEELVLDWIQRLVNVGIRNFSLSDTVGLALPAEIESLHARVLQAFPDLQLSLHLHAHPSKVESKILAALDSGCRRLEGALLGYGGCPFAEDELVGNVPTEWWIRALTQRGVSTGIHHEMLHQAQWAASDLFSRYR